MDRPVLEREALDRKAPSIWVQLVILGAAVTGLLGATSLAVWLLDVLAGAPAALAWLGRSGPVPGLFLLFTAVLIQRALAARRAMAERSVRETLRASDRENFLQLLSEFDRGAFDDDQHRRGDTAG